MASLLWQIALWCWVGSEILIALTKTTKQSQGAVRDRGTQLVLWVVIIAAIEIAGSIRKTYGEMFGGAHWLVILSVVVMIAALGLRWIAVLSLGKLFSANVSIQSSQKIHRGGLYQWIRHPSYLGLLLILLAIGIHSRNWISLAIIMVPSVAAVLYRIQIEENVLLHAFGKEYARYRNGTRRLLPWIY